MASPHPPPPPSVSSSKSITTEKTQPIPWTHQETVHLIHTYQEKWYSLERGQLKSSQWEEVAATVAARCGYSHFDPSKTSVQCRHKMEKLRQRFRSEKHRLSIGTQSSSRWLYFDLMSNLLRGPLPISARPMSSIPFNNDEDDQKSDNNYSDYEEEKIRRNNRSKSKSINNILRRPITVDGSSSRRRTRNYSEDEEEEEEEEEEDNDEEVEEEKRNIRVCRFPEEDAAAAEEGKDMCSKLAAEIRLFADRLVGMENWKMEMMKEAEMNRMAMENRRREMILESEKKIVNSIAKAFGCVPPKRMKIGHDYC